MTTRHHLPSDHMGKLAPQWLKTRKWAFMLLMTMALLVISPVEEVFDRHDDVISPLTGVVLMAVCLGLTEQRRTAGIMMALITFWIATSVLTDGSGLFAGASVLAPGTFMIILLAVFGLLGRWLSRASHVNSEVLAAAVCGYLLIGILWTGAYALIIRSFPGALVVEDGSRLDLGGLLYFSFTTLTTLGFGDIVPRDRLMRMIVITEAIVGMFYNTIVIARFVGLYGLKPAEPAKP